MRMTSEPPSRSSMRIAKAISSYEPSIKVNSVGLAGPGVRRFNASRAPMILKKPQTLVLSPSTESLVDMQRPSFNLVRSLQVGGYIESTDF